MEYTAERVGGLKRRGGEDLKALERNCKNKKIIEVAERDYQVPDLLLCTADEDDNYFSRKPAEKQIRKQFTVVVDAGNLSSAERALAHLLRFLS